MDGDDYVEPRLIGGARDLSDRMDLHTSIRTDGEKLFSVVEFLVDVEGCVRDIKVIRNDNQLLTNAFVRGLAESRFHPATLAGKSVEVIRTRAISRQTSR